MAKDPAFLFYPGDWLGGTILLTRHQKGCYFDLLMAQFNSGPLSLDQIKIVLGQDQAVWTVIQDKFQKDNNGKFFNQKLATEIEKRKSFVQSRASNKKGKTKSHDESYDESHENHMKQHMENENENRNVNELKKGVQGETLEDDLRGAFDEIYLEAQRMKPHWKHLDFNFELETFREKVRGSPESYAEHGSSGLRLAFQSQLRTAKPKSKNGLAKIIDDSNKVRSLIEAKYGTMSTGSKVGT